MEEFSINITDGCNADIRNIAEYISLTFLDDDLANKIALALYIDIKKLSYLATSFPICDDKELSTKGIRKYRIRKYIVYYVVDEKKLTVDVLRVRHSLQDEKKFFKI